ncbi:MAG TPA: aldo/keto reductase [Verrucomicrobiae bacterium]|nr:aldo/keto reductase [Verrucomicrobiae bacterium]
MIGKQSFGRTGHLSMRTILGGAALAHVTQDEADTAIELALNHGVNHVDTASSYGDSELLLGSWIRRNNKSFFLATKTGERSASKARTDLYRSLDRLQVQQIDLWQLHCLVDPEDWEVAFGPGGVMELAVEARNEKLIRFIGITAHGLNAPQMLQRSLDRFDFDSVMVAYNYVLAQNPRYLADFNALWEICKARNTAVQTSKAIVRGPWGDHRRTRTTWYRPVENQADIDRLVHWLLGHRGLFLSTVSDAKLLPKVLDAANRFNAPPPDEELQELVTRLELAPIFL